MAKTIFQENFQYIVDCFTQIKGDAATVPYVSRELNIKNPVTVYGWLAGRHIPSTTVISFIAENLKDKFGWDINAEFLTKIRLSGNFTVKKMVDRKKEDFKSTYYNNISADERKICKRLRSLRLELGYSLMQVSKRTKQLFPDENNGGTRENVYFQISHTHLHDIENGRQTNFHLKMLKGLATVYGEKLEHLIFGN